ncbi:MAG: DUF4330 domain-containing protein [Firmicutes bacterium]|nr:DUF4330 domain-containing protein [Bacillota bacterium]
MKKTKFTAIDLLIVIFLVLVIAFGFLKMKSIISDGGQTQKVRFCVLATNVDEGMQDIISVGDEVSISLKEKAYATVTNVTETQHFEDSFSANLGRYVSQSVIGKSDVLVELECMANVSDNEILNGNVPIRVGEESYIHGKGYSLHGYIVIAEETED